ncbi:MAG: ADP-heptose--LPS heptosyltransferase [Candidatus Poribacteria bacterium]|nr:MAG: ADP-heptose--LPS heptosyltransferase [Candidatus Poribacteria bacterium]
MRTIGVLLWKPGISENGIGNKPLRFQARTLREKEAAAPPLHRILCLRPDGIGDMVCCLPALESLRAAYPAAHLAVLAGPRNEELLREHPAVDRTLVADLRGRDGTPWPLWRLGRRLRRERFDAVFAFRTETRTHYLAWATQAPYRVGYADKPMGRWLTHALTGGHRRGTFHEIERNLALLELLAIPTTRRQPRLFLTTAERLEARQWLREHEIAEEDFLIGIHPGASTPDRCYPEERYAWTVARLQEREALKGRLVVLAFEGPADQAPVERLIQALKAEGVPYRRARTGGLRQMMALMAACRLVLANDSGPMHVAAALEVPFVAVFGPGDHLRWMPPGEHGRMVRPVDPQERDLRTIPATRILEAVEELILWIKDRSESSS